MKRYALYSVVLLTGTLMTAWVAGAAVSNMKGTKHDLTYRVTDPPIHASNPGATEICAFCHTPHSASADAPLWNRSDVGGPYTLYSSDVMGALGYPNPDQPTTKLGAGSADVHVKTRICLSCHDGTIALGNLVNLPTGFSADIAMSGTTAEYKMPDTAEGYIGTDLRDDHPVAVQYSGGAAGQDTELNDRPSVPAQINLYPSGGTNYVECTSCHDPHKKDYGNFLVMPNTNSALCTGCHGKEGYSLSAHDQAGQAYSPTDGTPAGTLGTTVGTVKCMACHFPHKSGLTYDDPITPNPQANNYLLSYQEEASCFIYNWLDPTQKTDRWNTPNAATACHGTASSSPSRIIQDLTGGSGNNGKQYGHHVGNYSGLHAATEDRNTGLPGNANTNWVNTGAGWHVECQDCHNAHTAGTAVHTPPTNDVVSGSPLYGTGGESMIAAPAWPLGVGSYSYREPLGVLSRTNTAVQKEYQICFKCHSDFAWGVNPRESPSLGGGAKMTNQAMEFGNTLPGYSYHPVVGTTQGIAGKLVNTAIAPNSWGPIGTNTMYCSDCHTKEGYTSPKGPHGSTKPFILGNDFTDTYGVRGVAGAQPSDLCMDCHDPSEYLTPAAAQAPAGTGFYHSGSGVNLHVRHAYLAVNPTTLFSTLLPWPYRCVNCHVRIPHGFNRKAMIGLSSDPAPYVTAPGKIDGYTPSATGYIKADCSTAAGCHAP